MAASQTTVRTHIPSNPRIAAFLIIFLFAAFPAASGEYDVPGASGWTLERTALPPLGPRSAAGDLEALLSDPVSAAGSESVFAVAVLGPEMILERGTSYPRYDFEDGFLQAMVDRIVHNGVGGRARAGASWVGDGWGLGAAAVIDAVDVDDGTFGKADITADAALVVGYSRSVEAGSVRISFGGNAVPAVMVSADGVVLHHLSDSMEEVRPFRRIMEALGDTELGWGVGFNTGGAVEWRFLRGSLTLADIGHTRYMVFAGSGAGLLDGNFGERASDADITVPMTLRAGLTATVPSERFAPVLHSTFTVPLSDPDLARAAGYETAADCISVGIEAPLSDAVSAMVTLDGGAPGFGVSMNLSGIALDASFVTDEVASGSVSASLRY